MKALEGWYPYLKGIEESINFLEGDVENLSKRKKVVEQEIADMVKAGNDVLEMDKKKAQKILGDAELLLSQAREIYTEVYKAKISKVVPPQSYLDEKLAKGDVVKAEIKKKKEAVA